jgi:phosphate starvation-inducible membrane PsiE
MLALAIPLGLFGIGIFCWLMFAAAVYALPCAVGVSVFLHAQQAGAGALGAIVLGVLAGAIVLVIGRAVFALVRGPILRVAVALIFAVPAAIAGYFMISGLSGLAVPSAGFQHAFAILGAIAVGITAWLRLAAAPSDMAWEGHHPPEQPFRQEAGRQTVPPDRRHLRVSSRTGARSSGRRA